MKSMSEKIRKELLAFQDEGYQEFNAKLIPNISKTKVIGIRIPLLREYAKKMAKDAPEEVRDYLQSLPHQYLEEDHLHAFLIEEIKDIKLCIEEIENFLPFIDNWQTCDVFSPKILKKYPKEVYEKIQEWLNLNHLYIKRYAIGLLLSNYLDEHFQEEMLEKVAKIQTEEYYLQMMIAWYFATALAKQYEASIPYLEEQKLDTWIHNKTIQKSIESRRISGETKEYLRTLKRKVPKSSIGKS